MTVAYPGSVAGRHCLEELRADFVPRLTHDGVWVCDVPLAEFLVAEDGVECRLKGTLVWVLLYGSIRCGMECLVLFEDVRGAKLWADAVFEVLV